MKKIYTLFALAALFSCTQELDPVVPENPTKENPEAVDPGKTDPEVPDGKIRLTFSVSSETTGTKTYLGDKDANNEAEILWSDGDQIRILWGTGESDYVDAEVVDGEVSADVEDAEIYYAVYPTNGAFALRDNGTIDFGIPEVQDGTFASANMMAARTTREAANFAFKNLTHIFKFHTTASNPYNCFEFTSNENAKVIANTYGVTFDEDQNVTVGAGTTVISGYSNTIYADLNSIEANHYYYFAVGPGAVFSSGFGVKARKSNSGSYELGALSKRAITTTRSKVTDLGDLDPMIHADWFIKPSGTGNGSSWENAGGLDLFLNLIKFQTNDNGVNSTWRLYNANIHFAEGTYDIYAANEGTLNFGNEAWDMAADTKYQLNPLNLTIDGGYPSSNTGTSLSGKDPVNHPTKWQTAQSDNTYRVFEAAGCRMSGWTFDGITFDSTDGHKVVGDAFYISTSEVCNITFSNCRFLNFVVASGTISGGPVYIHQAGASSNITFETCTFSGNKCNTGGAVYIHPNYPGTSTVNFSNCSFTNNSCTDSGGSIRARGGIINVSNSNFTGLGTDEGDNNTANHGGAIYVDGATANICGGTFSSCKTGTTGGALSAKGSSSTITADGVTFNSNKANNGGNISAENGASLYINNCSFANSTAINGAAIRTGSSDSDNKVSKVLIFNSIFTGNHSTSTTTNAQSGGTIIATGYSSILLANSTLYNNTNASESSSALAIAKSNSADNSRLYVVSCTMSGNTHDSKRTIGVVNIFNSILLSNGNDFTNVKLDKSIAGKKNGTVNKYNVYGTSTANKTNWTPMIVNGYSDIDFALGIYANGVYPLDDTYNNCYTQGMSAEELQSLTFSDLDLSQYLPGSTTETYSNLLAKDQKGNDRTGTIMGAYVLTTAPSE